MLKLSAFIAGLLVLAGCAGSAVDYLRKGNELYASGSYAEATLNYRKAIQRNPSWGEAHYRLGLARLKQGAKAEAHESFQRAGNLAPDLTDARVQQAELAWESYLADPRRPDKLRDEIEKLAKELLAKDPRSVDGLRFQGNLALADRQWAAALATFGKANQINPLQPEVVRGMVQALAATKQPAEAEKLALEMIAKDKTYGLIYDDLYALYRATDRPVDAERVFQTKVSNNPSIGAYRLQLAAHFANQSKQMEMEAVLKPLRDDAKTFAAGRIDVGEFYMRLRMWDAAAAVFDEAARNDKANRLVAQKRRIQALFGGGHPTDALRVADETVRAFPTDSETRLVRASMWLDTKDPARVAPAVQELERLRGKHGKEPIFCHLLGQAYLRQGDPRKAGTAFQDALKGNPGFKPALVALADLNLGNGQAKPALEYAERAAAVDRADPEVRLLHARALMQGGRPAEARAELTSLTSAQPEFASARLELGNALLAERKYDQAEAIFKKLYRPGQSDLRALAGLAQAYGARGEGQRAVDLVVADLKQSSVPDEVRRLLARVAQAAKQPELAIKQYTELIQAEPNAARNYYLLAQTRRAKGDVPGAIANLRKAVQLAPDDPVPLSVLAFLLQETGGNSEAATHLRRVLQLRPNEPNMKNNLAYLLAETGGDLDEARKLAQEAVLAAPGKSTYADTLGWVYLKSRSTDTALQIFQKLARRDPHNALYLYHLGVAQIQKGQKAEGRATLEQAMKNEPSPEIQARINGILSR